MENPASRSSVVTFSNNPKQIYAIPESQELHLNKELGAHIILADYQGNHDVNSHLGPRLAFAHLLESKTLREGTPQALLYLTASESDNPTSTQIWAQHLNDAGVQTFSMGIGPNVNGRELEIVAGNRADHVFQVDNYDQVYDQLYEISTKICNELSNES